MSDELNELDSMCMTWRHDFGLMTEEDRGNLRDDLYQLHKHHVLPLIKERDALKAELADAKKLSMDLVCENQGLKHKIDMMTKEQIK